MFLRRKSSDNSLNSQSKTSFFRRSSSQTEKNKSDIIDDKEEAPKLKRQTSKHNWESIDNNSNEIDNLVTEYQPKISSVQNYRSFLKTVHMSSSCSDDDDREHEHEVNTDKLDMEGVVKPTDRNMVELQQNSTAFEDVPVTPSDENDENFYESVSGSSPVYDNAGGGMTQAPIEDPEEKLRFEQEWKDELKKTEEEIATLRQVLSSKLRHTNELKKKLGITVAEEFKEDARHLVHQIQDSTAYKKTNEALKVAGEKASAAVSTVGKKLHDARNSQAFKSFEEKASSAYQNVKNDGLLMRIMQAKVTGSKSEGSFEEALQKDTNSNGDAKTETAEPALPEEKVPL